MDEALSRMRHTIEQAAAGDELDRLSMLTVLFALVKGEIAKAEKAALARHSVTAVAGARGVSHQYMSRVARRNQPEGSTTR